MFPPPYICDLVCLYLRIRVEPSSRLIHVGLASYSAPRLARLNPQLATGRDHSGDLDHGELSKVSHHHALPSPARRARISED